MAPINILILDDVPYVRKLIAREISTISGVQKIFEAEDTVSAVTAIKDYHPDLLVLDINVPGGMLEGTRYSSGLDVLRMAKVELPHSTVIMLTNNANEYYRRECKKAGADLFFDKTTEFDAFLDGIQYVIEESDY